MSGKKKLTRNVTKLLKKWACILEDKIIIINFMTSIEIANAGLNFCLELSQLLQLPWFDRDRKELNWDAQPQDQRNVYLSCSSTTDNDIFLPSHQKRESGISYITRKDE